MPKSGAYKTGGVPFDAQQLCMCFWSTVDQKHIKWPRPLCRYKNQTMRFRCCSGHWNVSCAKFRRGQEDKQTQKAPSGILFHCSQSGGNQGNPTDMQVQTKRMAQSRRWGNLKAMSLANRNWKRPCAFLPSVIPGNLKRVAKST